MAQCTSEKGNRTPPKNAASQRTRQLPNGLDLALTVGNDPALELAQGANRARVELACVKVVVAALADAATGLAELLAAVAQPRVEP